MLKRISVLGAFLWGLWFGWASLLMASFFAGKKIVGSVPRPHHVAHHTALCSVCGAGVFDDAACGGPVIGGDAKRGRLDVKKESRPRTETGS
jgi:hypothetical protein